MNTAPHPEPGYWFDQGRQFGRAGNQTISDDDFGRIFGEDEPPEIWQMAFDAGMAQGVHDAWHGTVDEPMPEMGHPPTVRLQIQSGLIRLAGWLLSLAERL